MVHSLPKERVSSEEWKQPWNDELKYKTINKGKGGKG